MARKSAVEKQAKLEAITQLRKMCPPGTEICTILRHRSRSGMYRVIDAYVIKRGEILRISWSGALAAGFRYDRRHEGIGVGGCGMDIGFHFVNSLSYALHGMTCKGDGAKPENAGRPFKPRRGHYRAGYSLEHRWL
jgi:hypothetical protein